MRIAEAILLNESIVDDLRNSLVRGLKPEHGPGAAAHDNLIKEYNKAASMAKTRFRKGEDMESGTDNSKVVWFLTWWVLDTKLGLIQQAQRLTDVTPEVSQGSVEQYNNIFTDKEIQKVKNKAKQLDVGERRDWAAGAGRGIFPEDSSASFVQALIHFLGTHGISDKIRAMPLKPDMPPLEAMEAWKDIEDEWLQSLKDDERSIPHHGQMYRLRGEDEIATGGDPEEATWKADFSTFIEFPDGSAWFNLNREFCKDEGKSMGHCGNTAGYLKGEDTILSYRTPNPHKPGYFTPHLTFIYNEHTHMIGEMKGYGNKKPSKKYHEVIKTLILDDRIKGIAGGGYLPEENFSVWDLDDAPELVKKKPLLTGDNLLKYVQMIGIDDTLTELVHAKMGEGASFVPLPTVGRGPDMVRLTDEYPNFFQLIEKEFSDAPYVHMLNAATTGGSWGTGSDQYDFEQQAIDLSENDDMEERTNYFVEDNTDPIINQIIIDELVHYSDGAPMDSIWDTLQEYGGEFSDWLNTSLLDASRTGWLEGIIGALLDHAIRTIEDTSSGYMGIGGKDVELEVAMRAPGRPDLEENTCSIQARIDEVLDVITTAEEHNEELGWDWWTPYAVEHEGGEEWDDDWKSDIHWNNSKAMQEFNTSIDNAPKLHTGETFREKYDRLKSEKAGKALSNESHKPEGKMKVFNLAKILTNTNSEKAHAKLHKVCGRLGLSADQCHAITSKAGYT